MSVSQLEVAQFFKPSGCRIRLTWSSFVGELEQHHSEEFLGNSPKDFNMLVKKAQAYVAENLHPQFVKGEVFSINISHVIEVFEG